MKKKLSKHEIDLLKEKFVVKYCKERNWNYNELTTGQMMIIVKQPGYINPKF